VSNQESRQGSAQREDVKVEATELAEMELENVAGGGPGGNTVVQQEGGGTSSTTLG